MRILIITTLALMLTFPLSAEVKGLKSVETNQPFHSYLHSLKKAIADQKMGIVAEACATCGAKAIGVTIPGNRVIMIFNPHFAVRMLKASIPAGIEAPLRLYVTENSQGMAHLSYRLPSDVFKSYGVKALDDMAIELDTIIETIVQNSL